MMPESGLQKANIPERLLKLTEKFNKKIDDKNKFADIF